MKVTIIGGDGGVGASTAFNLLLLPRPKEEPDVSNVDFIKTEASSGRRTRPPFRADHVGSLLRPPELLRARDDFAQGRIGTDELRAVEDMTIGEVVRTQEQVGLQSATDGEFRRASWHMDFIYQLGGIEQADEQLHVMFHNEQGDIEFESAACASPARSGSSARSSPTPSSSCATP